MEWVDLVDKKGIYQGSFSAELVRGSQVKPADFAFAPHYQELLTALHERQQRLRPAGSHRATALPTLAGRMVVGLGNSSAYELGMTLDRVYGLPYLPGSAQKGITRHWVIQTVFGGSEPTAYRNACFVALFGGDTREPREGRVIFMDAWPTLPPRMENDVMTPHYQPYYGGDSAWPGDYHTPNPITFLTLGQKADTQPEQDLPFYLRLVSREHDPATGQAAIPRHYEGYDVPGLCPPDFAAAPLCDLALYWLRATLVDGGIGAKTSVGYGFFHCPPIQPHNASS